MDSQTKRKLLLAPKLALLCLSTTFMGFTNIQAQTLQPEFEILSHIEKFNNTNPRERLEAVKALKNIGVAAIPALTAALQDEEVGVRSGAAFALGSMGIQAEKAIPNLLEALVDSNEKVRMDAAVALRRIGEPAVIPLAESLKNQNVELRRGAAFALAGVGQNGTPAISNLMVALGDDDEQVRLNSAVALRSIGGPAIPQLQAALQSSSLPRRSAAAFALGKVTLPMTTPSLKDTLQNQSQNTRLMAANVLEKRSAEAEKIANNAPGNSKPIPTPTTSPCQPQPAPTPGSCSPQPNSKSVPNIRPQQRPQNVQPNVSPNGCNLNTNPSNSTPNINFNTRPVFPR